MVVPVQVNDTQSKLLVRMALVIDTVGGTAWADCCFCAIEEFRSGKINEAYVECLRRSGDGVAEQTRCPQVVGCLFSLSHGDELGRIVLEKIKSANSYFQEEGQSIVREPW